MNTSSPPQQIVQYIYNGITTHVHIIPITILPEEGRHDISATDFY